MHCSTPILSLSSLVVTKEHLNYKGNDTHLHNGNKVDPCHRSLRTQGTRIWKHSVLTCNCSLELYAWYLYICFSSTVILSQGGFALKVHLTMSLEPFLVVTSGWGEVLLASSGQRLGSNIPQCIRQLPPQQRIILLQIQEQGQLHQGYGEISPALMRLAHIIFFRVFNKKTPNLTVES